MVWNEELNQKQDYQDAEQTEAALGYGPQPYLDRTCKLLIGKQAGDAPRGC
jgi:hypothetical protein